jgi:hypothetical protein
LRSFWKVIEAALAAATAATMDNATKVRNLKFMCFLSVLIQLK